MTVPGVYSPEQGRPRKPARSPQQQADDFMAANRKSPVVSGYAIEPDPRKPAKGASYTLADRTTHRLGVEACGLLLEGFPRWAHDGV